MDFKWAKPDKDGNINVPDELDRLVNSFGFQMRFHSISQLFGEVECICRMAEIAQEHFKSDTINFARWIAERDIIETMADGWEYDGKLYDDNQLFECYKSETAVAVPPKDEK